MEIWKACLYLHFYILLEGECHGNSVIPKHLFMITADTWNLVQESSLTSVVAGMALTLLPEATGNLAISPTCLQLSIHLSIQCLSSDGKVMVVKPQLKLKDQYFHNDT